MCCRRGPWHIQAVSLLRDLARGASTFLAGRDVRYVQFTISKTVIGREFCIEQTSGVIVEVNIHVQQSATFTLHVNMCVHVCVYIYNANIHELLDCADVFSLMLMKLCTITGRGHDLYCISRSKVKVRSPALLCTCLNKLT